LIKARVAATLASHRGRTGGARDTLPFIATLANKLSLVAFSVLRIEPFLAHTVACAGRGSAKRVVHALLALNTSEEKNKHNSNRHLLMR
jgi:hypothetical protein